MRTWRGFGACSSGRSPCRTTTSTDCGGTTNRRAEQAVRENVRHDAGYGAGAEGPRERRRARCGDAAPRRWEGLGVMCM